MKIAVRRTPSTSQKSKAEPSWSLIRLVAPTGITKNRPIARTSEKAIVRPHIQPPISSLFPSSSSSSWALAEIASARKPIFSDSARATTPRMTGNRRTRCLFAHETIGSEVISISAIGHALGLRPRDGSLRAVARLNDARRAVARGAVRPSRLHRGRLLPSLTLCRAAAEPLDAAAGVNQLLLARIEGMALRADLHVQLGLGGARVEVVPARAVDVREDVLGMDIGLHRVQF